MVPQMTPRKLKIKEEKRKLNVENDKTCLNARESDVRKKNY